MSNRESNSSSSYHHHKKRSVSYKPLSIFQDDDDKDDPNNRQQHAFQDENDEYYNETSPPTTRSILVPMIGDKDDNNDDDDEPLAKNNLSEVDAENDANNNLMQPLELQGCAQDMEDEYFQAEQQQDNNNILIWWRNPWLPGTVVSLFLVTPVLLQNCWMFYHLFGRIWTATAFSLHLTVVLTAAWCMIRRRQQQAKLRNESSSSSTSSRLSWSFLLVTSVSCVLDIVMFSKIYPMIWTILIDEFCTDFDGTDVVEWAHLKRSLSRFQVTGKVIWVSRCLLGSAAIASRVMLKCGNITSTSNRLVCCWIYFSRNRLIRAWRTLVSTNYSRFGLQHLLDWTIRLCLVLSVLLSSCCLYSLAVHWLPWPMPSPAVPADCDPLDETECAYPFPSYHHMVPDPSTPTGWRVHLQPHVLPPLKGNIAMDLEFFNRLDGFTTMGPILFYLDGLKEAHEAGAQQLQGPVEHVAQSITPVSVTLLLDVEAQKLVPHSAEIDFLDAEHPSVMIFPAQPLKHGTHYAVAVVNAKNIDGARLAPTRGMQQLMADTNNDRRQRYIDIVIPALEAAAEWFTYTNDPQALQLLFDFCTVSEYAQLGTVRTVRDATLTHIQSYSWLWKDHARAVRVADSDCQDDNTAIARTVHAEIDVPWFLKGFGPGHRGAVMDPVAITTGRARRLGKAKFVLHIPCSVRAAALGLPGGKPLRAILEYGHGIFSSRGEASDGYLLKTADNQGFAIVAMEWRGMSYYDLLVVAQILMAKPRLFEAYRDNLIQGYANKFALLHLVRNDLLSTDWFSFYTNQKEPKQVPTYNESQPVSAFYGNSQGGILGAGCEYTFRSLLFWTIHD